MFIIDAQWIDDALVVVSPQFERLEVPLAKLQCVRKASETAWGSFETDDHGRFLYWPALDVHMGWNQFEQIVSPEAKLKTEQRSRQFNKAYGAAIRGLRHEHGLTQAAIPGLDARTARRIESGETRATMHALKALSQAHSLSVDDYMAALAKRAG